MKCPFCGFNETKVVDSRQTEEGKAIRRRRECEKCIQRFTTYEKIEEVVLMVIKKDGSREIFDGDKILKGLVRACEKRPITGKELEDIVKDIEKGLNNMMKREVESSFIGELVMEKLQAIDEVAYVRFASVYRQFTDIGTFISEIEKLLGKKKNEKI